MVETVPPDVTASFPSLRDDGAGAGGSGGSCLFCGANGDEHGGPRRSSLRDHGARVTPEERDHTHAGFECRRQSRALIPRKAEIDAERTIGAPPRFLDNYRDFIRRRPRQR